MNQPEAVPPTPIRRLNDREVVKQRALQLAMESLDRRDTETALGAVKVFAVLRWGFQHPVS